MSSKTRPCPHCGHSIAQSAKTCPGCGGRVDKTNKLYLALALALLFVIVQCSLGNIT